MALALCLMGLASAAYGANLAPTISGSPPATAVAGTLYSFVPAANDPDDDNLKFTVSGLPRWASFDRRNGRIYGYPSSRYAGTTSSIRLSVSDGRLVAALPTFEIVVTQGAAPTIIGTPATSVAEGASYAFQPVAYDQDSATLTYSVANLPSWAVFSRATGSLSGTPGPGTAGTYAGVTISVSDGSNVARLPTFSITVTAAARQNVPPTISGQPAVAVKAGQFYSFTPTATDPDSTDLTFAITGKPAWAAFDATSGRLAGTPSPADAGTYSNIVISVSDGAGTARLAPFAIAVSGATSGTATLSWTAPTLNTDGTPINNLAGFRIRYGQDAAALDEALVIASSTITTAVIEGLAAGTWYFAVHAYNAANVESDASMLSHKTVN